MEIIAFRDDIYVKTKNQLFVFEATWDSFRPIDKVVWNGTKFTIIDSTFKSDLFEKNYGYGSLEMKAFCRRLTEETEFSDIREIEDPVSFWRWSGETTAKWWRDRPCVFESPCIEKSQDNWKKYISFLQTKPKTLRRIPRSRLTRRSKRV